MPVEVRKFREHTHFKVTGVPDVDEICAAIHAFFANCDDPVPRHTIWDFSEGSISAISADRFREVAEVSVPYAARRGPGAKTAFYMQGEMDVLTLKAYFDRTVDISHYNRRAFKDIGEMLAWLDT